MSSGMNIKLSKLKKFTTKFLIFLFLGFILISPLTLTAISKDQGFIEKSLEENEHFLKILNRCVSNLGEKKDINVLIKAIDHDFLARIWYLQGKYVKAFKEIRKSQEIMKDEFRRMLELYLDHTREFLESYAPLIIRSRDIYARHYLQLGFRDLKGAEDLLETGHNFSRLLFSNKIHIFMAGIKRAKRGKRYAILSMIESRTPRQEKPQFKVQTLDDIRNPKKAIVISSYERIRDLLQNMFARRFLPRFVPPPPQKPKMRILEHHDDNYSIISKNKCSILEEYYPEFESTADVKIAKIIFDRDIIIEEMEKKLKSDHPELLKVLLSGLEKEYHPR